MLNKLSNIDTFEKEMIKFKCLDPVVSKDYDQLIEQNKDIYPAFTFKLKQKHTGVEKEDYLNILKKYPITDVTDESIVSGLIDLYPDNEEYIAHFLSLLDSTPDFYLYFSYMNWLISTIKSKKYLLKIAEQVIDTINSNTLAFTLNGDETFRRISSLKISNNNLQKICKRTSITYEQIFNLLKNPHYTDNNRQSMYKFIKQRYHLDDQKFNAIKLLYDIKEGMN